MTDKTQSSAPKTYPIPDPMRRRLEERYIEWQRAKTLFDEDIELARNLAGAPERSQLSKNGTEFLEPQQQEAPKNTP